MHYYARYQRCRHLQQRSSMNDDDGQRDDEVPQPQSHRRLMQMHALYCIT